MAQIPDAVVAIKADEPTTLVDGALLFSGPADMAAALAGTTFTIHVVLEEPELGIEEPIDGFLERMATAVEAALDKLSPHVK